jgi:hypothetical protein
VPILSIGVRVGTRLTETSNVGLNFRCVISCRPRWTLLFVSVTRTLPDEFSTRGVRTDPDAADAVHVFPNLVGGDAFALSRCPGPT